MSGGGQRKCRRAVGNSAPPLKKGQECRNKTGWTIPTVRAGVVADRGQVCESLQNKPGNKRSYKGRGRLLLEL
jgi:hypothetical protein